MTIPPSSQGTLAEITPQPNDGVDPRPKECIGGPGSETLTRRARASRCGYESPETSRNRLQRGRAGARRPGPVAQGTGEAYLRLLEQSLVSPTVGGTPITEVAGSESDPGKRATTFYT